MATNRVYETGQYLSVVCSYPATPASGDPVLHGRMPGVAETAERSDGTTSVDFGPAVYTLSVTASQGAIASGDPLYASQASPVVISNDRTGVPFGMAMGAVSNGQTASINVAVGRFSGESGEVMAEANLSIRSKTFDIDIGAGVTDDDVVLRPAQAITIVRARIVYDEATAAAGATAATLQVGTAAGGAQIVAATNLEQPKAVGTTTAMTIASGAVAAGTPIFVRLVGVVATPIAGKVHVELDYRLV